MEGRALTSLVQTMMFLDQKRKIQLNVFLKSFYFFEFVL